MMFPVRRSARSALSAMVMAAGLVPGAIAAQLQETDPAAVEPVAAAVRRAGHACSAPTQAQRDVQHSTPQEEAWLIRCERESYRVIFLGDTGTRVERID